MKETIKLIAKPRQTAGSAAAGRIRSTGWFPAVVYGNQKANRFVQLNEHEFMMALRGHASEHLLLDLEIEGEGQVKALMKEVQHHPHNGHIVHVDFNEVSMTKRLRLEVPVHLVGDPVGVTQGGGILEHLARTVEIECLPADAPEFVNVDVSALVIGQALTIADIQLDASKYSVITDKNRPIATVVAPQAEPVAEEASAAPATPEVLTEKKAEEKASEEGKAPAAAAPGKAAAGKAEKK